MSFVYGEDLGKFLGFLKEGARKKSLKRLSKAEVASYQAARKMRRQIKYKTSLHEQKSKISEREMYSAGAFSD